MGSMLAQTMGEKYVVCIVQNTELPGSWSPMHVPALTTPSAGPVNLGIPIFTDWRQKLVTISMSLQ